REGKRSRTVHYRPRRLRRMKRKAHLWRSTVPRSLFLAFAASTLAVGSAAAAQTPPVGGPKPVPRAEFSKWLAAGFAKIDANHDGVVSPDEVRKAISGNK